ncbi:hypothetical protein NQ318_022479 [Aromia moschata]|uniref:Uncharacterized protein n=1 Tax=Aromia moschata TaxID=1265417 RepID=A0AAV8Z6Q3_9CUCU|nr:hypothetical protein NQ318_022479 [Aromia moschata]
MDRNVFIDWYKNVFIPSVKKRNPDPEANFILLVLYKRKPSQDYFKRYDVFPAAMKCLSRKSRIG